MLHFPDHSCCPFPFYFPSLSPVLALLYSHCLCIASLSFPFTHRLHTFFLSNTFSTLVCLSPLPTPFVNFFLIIFNSGSFLSTSLLKTFSFCSKFLLSSRSNPSLYPLSVSGHCLSVTFEYKYFVSPYCLPSHSFDFPFTSFLFTYHLSGCPYSIPSQCATVPSVLFPFHALPNCGKVLPCTGTIIAGKVQVAISWTFFFFPFLLYLILFFCLRRC